MNGIWLAASTKHGYVHVLEHEGDYADGDLLLNVTVGIDGVSVRTLSSEAVRVPRHCTCGAGAGPQAVTTHDEDCPMRGVNDQHLERPNLRHHDKDKLIAWLREGADELENAHRTLDRYEVPLSVEGTSVECTLAARIALALEEKQ